ncbi:FAD-dependent monooxygenase [Streptomyces sp. NBC_01795]|uniref:FAD-dependent monooxygenase n=1 Tax=unclassified Streptomyces TaxID=2593676 RepID=UPI002DD96A62|nr:MULTISPECIES: FAD-dependent monooxygenase [unclassified Streptomyces]WSA91373.1 FAD-dependent monooxygenase [Streptomyces sp. NBC_01795]WSB75697.1 FAD-dependent monooxygenase [Streptomyces sp. NBC_01775]
MDTDVIVAGAGPVGLALATELAPAGTRVVVVEGLAERSGQSKAMNLQPRTAEVLDLRGLLSRADGLSIGRIDEGHFAGIPLSYEGLDTRYPYQVGILQGRIEAVLEERLAELGGELRRGWELSGFEQDAEGVTVRGPETLRARYLAGCDGGRSTVRELLGVEFPGTEATRYTTITDVVLGAGTEEPPTGWTTMGRTRRRRADGSFASVIPIGEPGLYRLVYFDGLSERTEVTGEEVAAALRTFYGEEYELLEVRHASRFSDASRQAARYRAGRVFLAGDAAHIHPPAGGQGLNLGVQDALNLGWKVAAVVSGRMPETLLDTYHAERHPVGARVLDNTRAQGALSASGLECTALRKVLAELLDVPEANRAIAAMITGPDIDYGGPGPTGTRLPDFRIGAGWASGLFHSGHGVLLATDERHLAPAKPWADRVTALLVDELPWPDVEAALVRPDGYVCWTPPGEAVSPALRAWFGEAG